LLGSLLVLIDKVVGLLDFAYKSFVVLHVLSDLVDWEFDEHTGDLWSSLITNEGLDISIDDLSDLLLVVWVSLGD